MSDRERDLPSTSESRSVTMRLDGFAWQALQDEAAREGVSVEQLMTFAVLYYLADVDSGRVSRSISSSPYPAAS